MRTMFRRGLIVGALAGAAYAAWKAYESRREATGLDWRDQQFPFPPVAVERAWVDPVDGDCPEGFPVKAKISSGIYHLPGEGHYDRTSPDRCYRDATAAEADGLRPAKR